MNRLLLGVSGAITLLLAVIGVYGAISSGAEGRTFVSIGMLLGLVAMIASYLPRRRAVRVDPADALRS